MPHQPPIPPLVHFIFGLSDDPALREFTFQHYVAVHAAHELLRPAVLWLHHHYVPTGEWWARARPLLVLKPTDAHAEVFGRPLAHAAHRSDVLRLQLLITHGGIYLDMDVVVVRPFGDALLAAGHTFVMGKEGDADAGGFHGLCNAVMLARPNASFAVRWLEAYRDFGSAGDAWSHHSVQLPAELAEQHPGEVHVLPHTAFFWPDWQEDTAPHAGGRVGPWACAATAPADMHPSA